MPETIRAAFLKPDVLTVPTKDEILSCYLEIVRAKSERASIDGFKSRDGDLRRVLARNLKSTLSAMTGMANRKLSKKYNCPIKLKTNECGRSGPTQHIDVELVYPEKGLCVNNPVERVAACKVLEVLEDMHNMGWYMKATGNMHKIRVIAAEGDHYNSLNIGIYVEVRGAKVNFAVTGRDEPSAVIDLADPKSLESFRRITAFAFIEQARAEHKIACKNWVNELVNYCAIRSLMGWAGTDIIGAVVEHKFAASKRSLRNYCKNRRRSEKFYKNLANSLKPWRKESV